MINNSGDNYNKKSCSFRVKIGSRDTAKRINSTSYSQTYCLQGDATPPSSVYNTIVHNNLGYASFNPIAHVRRSIDKVQLNVIDTRKDIFNEFQRRFPHSPTKKENEKYMEIIYNFHDGASTKFQYSQKELKSVHYDNPWSTVIVHDVTKADQEYLISLLEGKRYSLAHIEFALDLYPCPNVSVDQLLGIISDGLVLLNPYEDQFKCVISTLYYQHLGDVHKGPKGIRIYRKPKDGPPFEFVRGELQLNNPEIRARNITLPVSPDSVSVFDYVEYRHRCRTDKVAARLAKQKKALYRHKRHGHKPYQEVLRTHVDFLLDQPNVKTPYDWRPAVAGQIDNFKREFPGLAGRVDQFFPLWQGRKELIQRWIKGE